AAAQGGENVVAIRQPECQQLILRLGRRHRVGLAQALPGRLHGAADRSLGHPASTQPELAARRGRPAAQAPPIPDRDSKFVTGFDEVFRLEGVKVATTPYRAPRANAVSRRTRTSSRWC